VDLLAGVVDLLGERREPLGHLAEVALDHLFLLAQVLELAGAPDDVGLEVFERGEHRQLGAQQLVHVGRGLARLRRVGLGHHQRVGIDLLRRLGARRGGRLGRGLRRGGRLGGRLAAGAVSVSAAAHAVTALSTTAVVHASVAALRRGALMSAGTGRRSATSRRCPGRCRR
jgi:hypothetical protein